MPAVSLSLARLHASHSRLSPIYALTRIALPRLSRPTRTEDRGPGAKPDLAQVYWIKSTSTEAITQEVALYSFAATSPSGDRNPGGPRRILVDGGVEQPAK